MKIIKKITAVVLAAATVAALSVAATAAYSDFATGTAGPYGTLYGRTTVSYPSGYVYFTTTTSTSKTAPHLYARIKVTNVRTSREVYNSFADKYDTASVSCQTPGFSNSDNYSSFSTNEIYGGNGVIINHVNTVANS